MTNAERFKSIFGIYATELWAMSEPEFLEWLNVENEPTQTNDANVLNALDCVDTISRQAAIELVHHTIFDFFDIIEDNSESPMTDKDEKLLKINKAICTAIKAMPSAERRGKWIDEGIAFVCSECSIGSDQWTNYCPNCGAKMMEEES